jgi:hypothetical protein
MTKRKKTDIVPLMLRLRESLRKQLQDAARVKDVSLNSEIVERLEESFTRASIQDEFDKYRVSIQSELRKLSDRLGGEIRRRDPLLMQMAEQWLNLAAQQADKEKAASMSRLLRMAMEQSSQTRPDQEPELPMPQEPELPMPRPRGRQAK